MQPYTLQRTGAAPVTFTGELIAEGRAPPEVGPKGWTRGHELRVYRTAAGAMVAEIVYVVAGWPNESGRSDVLIDPLGGLASALAHHDVTKGIVGYPPGQQFAERQQRLLAAHRASWERLVSEVLGQLPGAAEEVP